MFGEEGSVELDEQYQGDLSLGVGINCEVVRHTKARGRSYLACQDILVGKLPGRKKVCVYLRETESEIVGTVGSHPGNRPNQYEVRVLAECISEEAALELRTVLVALGGNGRCKVGWKPSKETNIVSV